MNGSVWQCGELLTGSFCFIYSLMYHDSYCLPVSVLHHVHYVHRIPYAGVPAESFSLNIRTVK